MIRPNIIFVGHGRSGKDASCELLARHTGWVNAGTCSIYLLPHMARYFGVSEATAYAERHLHRAVWREQGDLLRRDDPLALVRPMLQAGRIGGGVRGLPEIRAAREICDLIVWVDRPGNPVDPTMEYGEEETDFTLVNSGTLVDLERKIIALAALLTGKGFRPKTVVTDSHDDVWST